jgi:OOP family OmpA-OmpF porin
MKSRTPSCRPRGSRRLRGIAALCAGALVALGPVAGLRVARADPAPSIDARTFRAPTDPRAGLVLEPTTTPGPWLWNASVFVDYARDPVALRGGTDNHVLGHPLADRIGADLVFDIGLGDRAAVAVDVPFSVWQDGTPSSGFSGSVVDGGKVPTAALGDVAVTAKATIVSNDRKGVTIGPGLAVRSTVTLPTGDPSSFAGEGALTAAAEIVGEYAVGAAAVRASLGYFLRPERRTWPATDGVTFGDSVTWAASFVLRPKAFFPSLDQDDRQIWELGAHGAVPAGPVAPFALGQTGASALSPAVLVLDDRVGLGHYRDTYLVVGAEIGLDQAVGVPIIGGVVAIGWAPRNHDRDDDGVLDDADQCPELPEDRDGIQDEDGCPEDDADGDGILDEQDACPLVAGVPSNDPKKNGCPP